MARWGLRWKSIIALSITALIVTIAALLIGWLLISEGREYSARTYATNFTELNYQKVLTPVRREIALVERLADLSSLKAWMAAPSASLVTHAFYQDLNGFKQTFADQTLFFVADADLNYHFYDNQLPVDGAPRYQLSTSDVTNRWYFQFAQNQQSLGINIDYSEQLNLTKIWINARVQDNGRFLGVAGTGFALDEFVKEFTQSPAPGIQPFIVDATTGAIKVHPDRSLIAFDEINSRNEGGSLYSLVDDSASIKAVNDLIREARSSEAIVIKALRLNHKDQLLAAHYLPELDWLVMTSVSLEDVRLLNTDMLMGIGALFVLLIMLVLGLVAFLVERLVIRPIRQLQQSANAIARGAYEVRIPTYHDDEVGDLSRAFNKMAQQVAEHTTLLEAKVKERTLALEQSNRLVQEANRKLGDSIDYASLIQQAILPDRVMSQRLGQGYSVLWRPRDVVGGDFYVFHDHQDGYLVGIIDCAGHGVPGALMTMLVRAAVDRAIHELGVQNPAKLLQHIDSTVRNMLNEESVSARVATNADAGLVFIPKQGGTLRFSGAKIPLYRVVDGAVERIKASRRALADGKVGEFENVDIDGGNSTFCLTTDGFLDQSGGHKRFGFGNKRFEQLLLQCSSLGLDDQIQQLEQSLLEYMGDNAQRDDITLLMFRVSDTAIGEKEC